MEHIPGEVWTALAALLTGLGVHFTHKIRQARRSRRLPEPEELRITEKLRSFVDGRAQDVVRPVLQRIQSLQEDVERVETDLKAHMSRTQNDVQAFYVLTAKLTVEVSGMREDMAKHTAAVNELTRAVGRLEGRA